jgi:hypothetical protein
MRCEHTWEVWERPCGLLCLPLRCCSCLQCVTLVDRIPGQSTWGSPTTNKHPWTPEGSEGARGLLPLPCRSPVVSVVLACPPGGSLEDQFIHKVEWTICVQRASTCRTRNAQCDTGGRGGAPRRRRRRVMLRTPSARRTLPKAPPPARAAARPALSTCKATGEATFTGCWRDAECRRRLFLFIDQATNSHS